MLPFIMSTSQELQQALVGDTVMPVIDFLQKKSRELKFTTSCATPHNQQEMQSLKMADYHINVAYIGKEECLENNLVSKFKTLDVVQTSSAMLDII